MFSTVGIMRCRTTSSLTAHQLCTFASFNTHFLISITFGKSLQLDVGLLYTKSKKEEILKYFLQKILGNVYSEFNKKIILAHFIVFLPTMDGSG